MIENGISNEGMPDNESFENVPPGDQQPQDVPVQAVQQDEEYTVPSGTTDILTVTKQDLRQFLEPLPQEIMKYLAKIDSAITADPPDFAMLRKMLPIFCEKVRNHRNTKQRDLQNVEDNIVRLLNEFENRAIKAESQVEVLRAELTETYKSHQKLENRYIELAEARIKDFTDDPVRKTMRDVSIRLMKLKLREEEAEAKLEFQRNNIEIEEEDDDDSDDEDEKKPVKKLSYAQKQASRSKQASQPDQESTDKDTWF